MRKGWAKIPLVLLTGLFAARAHAAEAYTVIELGTIEEDGSDDTWALGISEDGAIVGVSQGAAVRVFVWTPTDGIALVEDAAAADGVLHGTPLARGADGSIVGLLEGGTLHRDGAIVGVDPVAGDDPSSVLALGLNDLGRIVGYSGATEHHALAWQDGVTTQLAPAGVVSEARDVDDSGVAVGWQLVGALRHASTFDQSGATELTMPDGYVESYAVAINSAGDVVGGARAQAGGTSVGVLWASGIAQVHDAVPCIIDINASGTMIATACDDVPSYDEGAWVSDDGTEWAELDDLTPPGTMPIVTVHGINDDGHIAGTMRLESSAPRGVALVPDDGNDGSADLRLLLSQQSTSYCGGELGLDDTYGFRVEITNQGPATATGVTLTVDVDTTKLVAVEAASDTGYELCTNEKISDTVTRVTCPLVDLPDGASGGADVDVTIETRDEPGIDVVASVSANEPEPTPFDNEATVAAELDQEAYDGQCGSGGSDTAGGSGCFLCRAGSGKITYPAAGLFCLALFARRRRRSAATATPIGSQRRSRLPRSRAPRSIESSRARR